MIINTWYVCNVFSLAVVNMIFLVVVRIVTELGLFIGSIIIIIVNKSTNVKLLTRAK